MLKPKASVSIVLLQLIVGVLLGFPFPVLEWGIADWPQPQSNLWNLFQWLPCLGFIWIVAGALTLQDSLQVRSFVRGMHLCLMIFGCPVTAFGVVVVAFATLGRANSRGGFSGGAVMWLGMATIAFSLLLIAASFGVLYGLRILRTCSPECHQLSIRKRQVASIAVGFLGVLYSTVSWGFQAVASVERQQRIQATYEEQLQSYAYDSGEVKTLVFSPDSNLLASAVKYRVPGQGIRVWDVETGRLLSDFVSDFDVHALCFTPDGSRLIVGFEEDWMSGGVAVIDLVDNREIMRANLGPVRHIVISPDGSSFLACSTQAHGSAEAPFTVWNLQSLEKVYESAPSLGYVEGVFSESGKAFAVRRRQAIEVWPFPVGEASENLQVWDPRSAGDGVTAFSFHAKDSRVTVAGIFDVKTWDLDQVAQDPKVEPTLLPLNGPLTAAVFTKDRTCLITADQDQSIYVVDLDSGRVQSSWKSPYWVSGLAVSSSGEFLAEGGHQRILLRDLRTGEARRELSQGFR